MLLISSLTLLSCKFVGKEQNGNLFKIKPRLTMKVDNDANIKKKISTSLPISNIKITFNKYSNKKQLFVTYCFLLLVGCQIQANESKVIEKTSCVCNGQFYSECPESCNRVEESLRRAPEHEYSHPDHSIDEIGLVNLDDAFFVDPYSNSKNNLNLASDNGYAIRHRKVYLSKNEKPTMDKIIHPFTLTIPVHVPQDIEDKLPEPKPIFKMKKYTYQETKPEIEMVPVTTTIIKPVGVSKEQIY